MNKSDYLVGFLSSDTQRAYAKKAGAAGEGEAPEKEDRPASADVQLLRRVQRIVFSPSVTTLDQAVNRLESLIDSLQDDDTKKNEKPVE
jgi:hypothetical protein